ncbi:hypothetical protein KUTeg_024177, partial [Tegillarca granosa]
MALSQASTTSSVCMIPPDLVEDQDAEFYSEIVEVNDLYFGNFDVEDTEVKSDHNHDTDDNDSESDSDCDNANISHNLDNDGDLKEADKSEYDLLSQFKKQTCGCNRLYGSPCSANVDWESVIEYRRHCQEMTNDELDVAIKFQLFHHRRNDSVTDKKKHKSKERERSRQEYFFSGKRVCRVTFAFAHGVNRKKVDAIAHSLDNEGLGARSHGNKGRLPKHALTLNDVQIIKQFVISYGNKFGLPLPGRLPNYREHKTVLLPSDKTKYDVYSDYVSAAEEVGLRKISLSEFKKIWLEQCPHIMIMRPTTDLCHKCQSYVTCIKNSGSLSEEEKCELLNEYVSHLEKCKIQREEYRTQCDEAKINFSQLPDDKKIRGSQIFYLLVGDAQRPVIFYDWSKYLKEYFKPIPHLKTYHHFRVSRHNPGIVFVKEYANSPEVEINVLRNQNCRFPHLDPELPAVIPPKGLDPARQWYLYEEVAPYCNNKDSCKKPDVTKPILKAEQSEEYDKKRKCSHCKSCGHTKSRGSQNVVFM